MCSQVRIQSTLEEHANFLHSHENFKRWLIRREREWRRSMREWQYCYNCLGHLCQDLQVSLGWGLGGCCSILSVSCFMWSGALESQPWSSSIILCNITIITHDHYTDIILFWTYKHINIPDLQRTASLQWRRTGVAVKRPRTNSGLRVSDHIYIYKININIPHTYACFTTTTTTNNSINTNTSY